MGLMNDPTSGAQLVLTPHPVTLDGQEYIAANLAPGEKLGGFLARTVPQWSGDCWEVRINGVLVPHEILDRVRPKENALIEVRGVVKKQVLMIVALAALAFFTMGAGLAIYAAAVGVTSAVGIAVLGAVTFAVGSALINKVLGPKPPKQRSDAAADPVYSIGSARNSPRPYEPLPILFGTVRIAPDVASMPYSWYEGKEQIMGQVFTPGVNVHSVEALYNGNTLLSSYDGVTVYNNGLPGHADENIPLYSNADTIAGGELNKDATWVERGTPLDTVRIQVNLEYLLGDSTNKGKPYPNQETVEVEYRETGDVTWLPLMSRRFVNKNMDTQRATLSADVARGQYDVRVRRMGQSNPEEGHNARAQFQWVTMTAVQADDTDYTGIPRIGIRIKATGQLNGALDEIRCVAHSLPTPLWTGTAWSQVENSNPGAHLLAYARGIYDANGRILAGIGLPDSQIDIPALQAFMTHCTANGYTYDAYIKDARNHAEMCDAIALAGLGQLSWASGRLGVVWADSAQPLTGIVNMATIKKGSFQTDYTLANAADGIEYTYVDPVTWQPATLRVEAPGITTMQNPARVTGEGVTSEAHAAKMARYHLAQHLYQYKDISFSTDLEHLTYRRLSLLALSHDMTQWGHGGRLRGAVDAAGVITVQLDEPVPSLATPYIGLRIPGEGVYRVFSVAPFVGETDTLTLVEPWPEDAAFPGDVDDNPAHDTIWIYDIKATPGYRVRVVQIEPESDLQGARVSVVPESSEFWAYVNTGAYTPPVNQSLLNTRPVASNLRVIQSYNAATDDIQLQAIFDVQGAVSRSEIYVARVVDSEVGEFVKVAETRGQSATWVPDAVDIFIVEVRPFGETGRIGTVDSIEFEVVTGVLDEPPLVINAHGVADAVALFASSARTPGAKYVWERALMASGPWLEIGTTQQPTMTYPEVTGGGAWYRVTADSVARRNEPSDPAYAAPSVNDFSARVLDLVIGFQPLLLATEDVDVLLCTEAGALLMTEAGDGDEITIDCRYSRFRLGMIKDVGAVKFANVQESHELVIEVRQSGAFTIALPANVIPVSGQAYQPTAFAGAVDVIRLITMDYGTTWRLIVDKSGFGVTLSPSPAKVAIYVDATPVAPSIEVVADVFGADPPVTYLWTRETGGVTPDFLASSLTVADPTFTTAAGLGTYAESQIWRCTATDTDGGIASAAVEVYLGRVQLNPVVANSVNASSVVSPGGVGSVIGTSTAVPHFGTAPYTYSWSIYALHSGAMTLTQSGATATFSMTSSGATSADATARVTVTDSLAESQFLDVPVRLSISATNPPPAERPGWRPLTDYSSVIPN